MLSGQVQMPCDVETHLYVPPDHPKPFHFTWNSKWFHVKFQVKIFFWFAAKKCSHDSSFEFLCFPDNSKWSVMWRPPVCAIRSHSISLGIPSDSMWFQVKFQVKISLQKVLSLYLFRIFRLSVQVRMLCGAETHRMCHSILLICISLGIPSDSMWNSKWTYFCGMRQKSILMVVVLYLYGFWKSSSALWCGGHRICRDNFTWNFT